MEKTPQLTNRCSQCRKFKAWDKFKSSLPYARGQDGRYMELTCDECLFRVEPVTEDPVWQERGSDE